MSFLTDKCRSFLAIVIWLKNERTNQWAPIDAEPSAEGNCQLITQEGAGRPSAYRVLHGPAKVEALARGELHTSHFATCPDAPTHRRRTGGGSAALGAVVVTVAMLLLGMLPGCGAPVHGQAWCTNIASSPEPRSTRDNRHPHQCLAPELKAAGWHLNADGMWVPPAKVDTPVWCLAEKSAARQALGRDPKDASDAIHDHLCSEDDLKSAGWKQGPDGLWRQPS